MQPFFLLCLAIGGAVLALQIVAGFFGLGDHDFHIGGHDLGVAHHGLGGSDVAEGLQLLSVRSIAAALAVYGASGLALAGWMPAWLAAVAATVPGFLAALGTAYLMRFLVRMESSGSLRLEDAVGATGQVYLTVPAAQQGTGLVQFPLQGRSVELRAITREGEALKTGSSVLVISVDPETETVEVVSTSNIEGLLA
jgi:hypothetical protein